MGNPVTDDSDDPKDLTNSDPNLDGEPDDPTMTPLPGQAQISIIKAGTFLDENGDGVTQVGETIRYEIRTENTGTVTLTNVEVNDPLFGGIIESGLTLIPGGFKITVRDYTITSADIVRGEIVNQAVATGNPPSGPPVTDDSDDPKNPTNDDPNRDGEPDDPTVILLNSQPQISITKVGNYTDAAPVGISTPGEIISYSFRVENTGNVALNDIEVSDPLLGGLITTIPTLAPGQFTYLVGPQYMLTQADIDRGIVINSATASGMTTSGLTAEDQSDDPMDPVNNDINGDGEPDDPTITPLQTDMIPNVSIVDPCGCADPLNYEMDDMFFLHEFVVIRSEEDQLWFVDVANSTGIYDNAGNPIGMDAIEEGPDGVYTIDVWVKQDEAYTFQG